MELLLKEGAVEVLLVVVAALVVLTMVLAVLVLSKLKHFAALEPLTRDVLGQLLRAERDLIEAALRPSKSAVAIEKRLDANRILRTHFNEAQREFDKLEHELMEEFNGLERGGLSAPVEGRILFRRGNHVQVRQARITCRLDQAGRIVAML